MIRDTRSTGRIDYAITLLNPAPPTNGSGVIATITSRAKANGASLLKAQDTILATRALAIDQSSSAATTAPSGQPPAAQTSASWAVIATAGISIFSVALVARTTVLKQKHGTRDDARR